MEKKQIRTYDIEGKQYVSVTTYLDIINKPGINTWYALMERQAFKDAITQVLDLNKVSRKTFLDIVMRIVGKNWAAQNFLIKTSSHGKVFHGNVEETLNAMIENREPALAPMKGQVETAYNAWRAWFTESGLKPLKAELTVYDGELEYAGTLDLYAETAEAKRVVVDWKTSKQIYPSTFLQVTAYRHALENMGYECDGSMVVAVPRGVKTPRGIHTAVVPQGDVTHEALMDVFRAVVALWRGFRQVETLVAA